ncbi:MAG: serine hydrolase [Acidobacteriia bacterium]|nr:serine hydrolase [Terriglobia bacterium]
MAIKSPVPVLAFCTLLSVAWFGGPLFSGGLYPALAGAEARANLRAEATSGGRVFLRSIALPAAAPLTRVSIAGDLWRINGRPTYAGTSAEGLLMNVRMVNAVFEDHNRPDFDPEANTTRFIARIPENAAHGIRAFTLSLQGGAPGYEGAVNSAFHPDGSLRQPYLDRVRRVIEACDRNGTVVILGCFYQRQDQVLQNEAAVRAGVVNAAGWLGKLGYGNVVLEITNEFGHKGFDHPILRTAKGQAELIRLAKNKTPGLLVSTSGTGGGSLPEEVAQAADFLLVHFNNTRLDDIPARVAMLKRFGKPIVCNEDDRPVAENLLAAELSAAAGASWGLMLSGLNQRFPFEFHGAADAPEIYAKLRQLTASREWSYFPPPEQAGGWPKLDSAGAVRTIAGMDPGKLDSLREWLLASDRRDFAAVVIRRGRVVLEVLRNTSSVTAVGNIKSCAKAICATVAGIAAERSRRGATPLKMTFDDPAFDFLPWAEPLSDPRKRAITVKQLLNHTSGITPESSGARNQGPWEFVLGHSGDPRTAQLAFDPGTDLGYSTHAFYHAALVIEQVTGMQYDQFAIEALLKPIGVEKWWFESFDGGEKYGRHASHALGLPARDMARIAYCMLRAGRWNGRQVIPAWFVTETGEPTHSVKGIKSFDRDAESWSHGWELPARLSHPRGAGIPQDARFKPGSGGQLIAFVPSLDLVVVRQTGGSGAWEYEEYLRRACDAVVAR